MNAVYQNVIVLTVIAGLPFLSWAVSGPRRSPSSLMFLVGMAFYAAAAAVYLFRPDIPSPWVPITIRSLVYTATLLMNEFVRRTIGRKRSFDIALWILAVIIVPLSVGIEFRFGQVGVLVHHSFMVFLQLTVLGNLLALYQQDRSRGLFLMGAAILVVLLANISQVLSVVVAGVVLQPDLEGVAGLLVYLANILWVMLFSIGYWSYTVDRAKSAEMQAEIAHAAEQQRRKTAESLADQMSNLVRERDELIMVNSRFETLNNVGVFNAAVIHELSQPVQRMLTKIEHLTDESMQAEESLKKNLQQVRDDALETSEIIHAVRSLLIGSSTPATFITAKHVMAVVRPIFESQAKVDGVWLSIEIDDFPEDYGIIVNHVLFNRVILNLVSNALTALRERERLRKQAFVPRLEIHVRNDPSSETGLLRIDIWDNGVGFPSDFDSTLKTLSKTSKPGGMGVGLILSRQIMSTWRGAISVANQNDGTMVSCSIPLIRESLVHTQTS
jgi:signal transduction histidine kinase